jgi:hypothetical protein
MHSKKLQNSESESSTLSVSSSLLRDTCSINECLNDEHEFTQCTQQPADLTLNLKLLQYSEKLSFKLEKCDLCKIFQIRKLTLNKKKNKFYPKLDKIINSTRSSSKNSNIKVKQTIPLKKYLLRSTNPDIKRNENGMFQFSIIFLI